MIDNSGIHRAREILVRSVDLMRAHAQIPRDGFERVIFTRGFHVVARELLGEANYAATVRLALSMRKARAQ